MEMKFGDLLEEFIFIVFKYQRRSKGIDYFQSTDDEFDQKTVSHHEELKDTVQLQVSPKAFHPKIPEQQYEMCTVVEESMEEEGEDSPINKKILSPIKFHKEIKYSPNSAILSPDDKSRPIKSRLSLDSEKSAGLALFSPLEVPTHDLPPDLGASLRKYIETQEKLKKALPKSASDSESNQLQSNEELVKIENLLPASTENNKEAQRKDSKVKIIEKLESKIFKLLKDAKKQIEKSKEKKVKFQKISAPLVKSARNPSSTSKEKKNYVRKADNFLVDPGISPEKKTAYKLIEGKGVSRRAEHEAHSLYSKETRI